MFVDDKLYCPAPGTVGGGSTSTCTTLLTVTVKLANEVLVVPTKAVSPVHVKLVSAASPIKDCCPP